MGYSTKKDFINRNGQKNLGNTGKPGNDHLQYIYKMKCTECGHTYGANGSDIFERKCPAHQGGRPGLPI